MLMVIQVHHTSITHNLKIIICTNYHNAQIIIMHKLSLATFQKVVNGSMYALFRSLISPFTFFILVNELLKPSNK